MQGGAAEAVAAQLEGRLRAALKARGNPFSDAGPAAYGAAAAVGGRPLLALFDRTFELRYESSGEVSYTLSSAAVHQPFHLLQPISCEGAMSQLLDSWGQT